MMLASMFQFSFLCIVSLANLCMGFAVASWLGWGPALSALFEFGQPETHDTPAESGDGYQTPEA